MARLKHQHGLFLYPVNFNLTFQENLFQYTIPRTQIQDNSISPPTELVEPINLEQCKVLLNKSSPKNLKIIQFCFSPEVQVKIKRKLKLDHSDIYPDWGALTKYANSIF